MRVRGWRDVWWRVHGEQGGVQVYNCSATNNTYVFFLPLYSPPFSLPSSPPSLSPDNDTLVFIDFRADRMRQIVEAMGIKPQFDTDTIPKDLVSLVASSHVEF